jgi:hypothetical protein
MRLAFQSNICDKRDAAGNPSARFVVVTAPTARLSSSRIKADRS